MDFNLRYGMTDDEFLGEVKGKIHGESRQQIQDILKPQSQFAQEEGNYVPGRKGEERWNNEHINALSNDFKVISIDSEKRIAVIAKRWINHWNPLMKIDYEFYLMGMNYDDRSYFMHPMHGYDSDGYSALEWVNRREWGFENSDRVQGDVLLSLMKLEPCDTESDSILSRIKGLLSKGDLYVLRNWSWHDNNPYRFLFEVKDGRVEYVADGSLPRRMSLEKGPGRNTSASIFNNHIIKTDGDHYNIVIEKMERTRYPLYVIVNASYITLEHNEHPRYTTHVPLGHAAIITAQRGQVQYTNPQQMVD